MPKNNCKCFQEQSQRGIHGPPSAGQLPAPGTEVGEGHGQHLATHCKWGLSPPSGDEEPAPAELGGSAHPAQGSLPRSILQCPGAGAEHPRGLVSVLLWA